MEEVKKWIKENSGVAGTIFIGFFGLFLTLIELVSSYYSYKQEREFAATTMVVTLWGAQGSALIGANNVLATAIERIESPSNYGLTWDSIDEEIKKTHSRIKQEFRIFELIDLCVSEDECSLNASCITFGTEFEAFYQQTKLYYSYVNVRDVEEVKQDLFAIEETQKNILNYLALCKER